jgi:hypothetical protein
MLWFPLRPEPGKVAKRRKAYMLDEVEIRHWNFEKRMFPNHVADCLACLLLIKEMCDMILFSKAVILIDALRGVSDDIQTNTTLIPRLEDITVLYFLPIHYS